MMLDKNCCTEYYQITNIHLKPKISETDKIKNCIIYCIRLLTHEVIQYKYKICLILCLMHLTKYFNCIMCRYSNICQSVWILTPFSNYLSFMGVGNHCWVFCHSFHFHGKDFYSWWISHKIMGISFWEFNSAIKMIIIIFLTRLYHTDMTEA